MTERGDHDLLTRIDERVQSLQCTVQALRTELREAQEAIVSLRVQAAKWGGIAGVVSGTLVTVAGMATTWLGAN